MKTNQLIYLAFGKETYQIEAFCSIATAIARSQETPDFAFDINGRIQTLSATPD